MASRTEQAAELRTRNSSGNLKHNDIVSRRPRRNAQVVVDDIIVSLSNAYENKRARQVTEWENIGRQTTTAYYLS